MNRRNMLALFGATSVTMLSGHSSGNSGKEEMIRKMFSCIATPQQTEGPYFVDEHLNRADIRSDPSDGSIKEGLPLTLDIACLFSETKPAANRLRALWWTSGTATRRESILTSGIAILIQSGKKFLRGYQMTDTNGGVRFTTIYPGWYPGRTVHIHFKIRTDPKTMQTS